MFGQNINERSLRRPKMSAGRMIVSHDFSKRIASKFGIFRRSVGFPALIFLRVMRKRKDSSEKRFFRSLDKNYYILNFKFNIELIKLLKITPQNLSFQNIVKLLEKRKNSYQRCTIISRSRPSVSTQSDQPPAYRPDIKLKTISGQAVPGNFITGAPLNAVMAGGIINNFSNYAINKTYPNILIRPSGTYQPYDLITYHRVDLEKRKDQVPERRNYVTENQEGKRLPLFYGPQLGNENIEARNIFISSAANIGKSSNIPDLNQDVYFSQISRIKVSFLNIYNRIIGLSLQNNTYPINNSSNNIYRHIENPLISFSETFGQSSTEKNFQKMSKTSEIKKSKVYSGSIAGIDEGNISQEKKSKSVISDSDISSNSGIRYSSEHNRKIIRSGKNFKKISAINLQENLLVSKRMNMGAFPYRFIRQKIISGQEEIDVGRKGAHLKKIEKRSEKLELNPGKTEVIKGITRISLDKKIPLLSNIKNLRINKFKKIFAQETLIQKNDVNYLIHKRNDLSKWELNDTPVQVPERDARQNDFFEKIAKPSNLKYAMDDISINNNELVLKRHMATTTNSNSMNRENSRNDEKDVDDISKVSTRKPTYEISMIADRVYRMIEKRLSIEKDRRGLF